MRVPRPLDEVEIRVLGCLLEKQQTTPDQYPLTVNALVAACNQRSNRDPVMDLAEGDVRAALHRLREHVLVWSTQGARSERFEHNLDRRWQLDAPAKALITELLLRGPQTLGELRARSERAYSWTSLAEVEATLERLAEGPEPLLRELPRRPGQREARWMHCVGQAAAAQQPTEESAVASRGRSVEERLAALEARLEALAATVAELSRRLGAGDELPPAEVAGPDTFHSR